MKKITTEAGSTHYPMGLTEREQLDMEANIEIEEICTILQDMRENTGETGLTDLQQALITRRLMLETKTNKFGTSETGNETEEINEGC